jgi:hypothetical protein
MKKLWQERKNSGRTFERALPETHVLELIFNSGAGL